MPSIFFICTANLCRSPIAMAILENRIYQLFPLENWRVESAGIWTQDGLSPISIAREVIASRGLNINGHRSRQVTHQLVNSFDLILAMENWQKSSLQENFPEIAGRVFLLSEMTGSLKDIHDPSGSEKQSFITTVDEIEDYIIRGFERIIELAKHF